MRTAAEYIIELSKAYAAVKKDSSLPDALRKCKLEALQEIAGRTSRYANGLWDPLIINGYAIKKARFILEAQNKTQIEEILKPAKPHYDGNAFRDGPYQVDEEELIGWSEASLRAPPNERAVKRMIELMYKVFPHERLKTLEDLDL